jgi:hypothetical protein
LSLSVATPCALSLYFSATSPMPGPLVLALIAAVADRHPETHPSSVFRLGSGAGLTAPRPASFEPSTQNKFNDKRPSAASQPPTLGKADRPHPGLPTLSDTDNRDICEMVTSIHPHRDLLFHRLVGAECRIPHPGWKRPLRLPRPSGVVN